MRWGLHNRYEEATRPIGGPHFGARLLYPDLGGERDRRGENEYNGRQGEWAADMSPVVYENMVSHWILPAI
jgi:hypothetical protein